MLKDNLAKSLGPEHLGLGPIAQDPPAYLVQPRDRHREIQRAVVVQHGLLCLVPLDFGHVLGDLRRKTNDHLLVGAWLGNQMPRIAEVAAERETAGNFERIVEQFQFDDPSDVEGSYRTVNRRTADHVPTASTEQEPIGRKFGSNELPFSETVVANPHGPLTRRGLEKLFVDRLLAVQRVARRHPNLHVAGCGLQVVAEPPRKAAVELRGGLPGRGEEGHLGVVAQILAQHDQREGFLGREIRRRKKRRPRDAVTLQSLVVEQRNARLA